MPPDLDTKLTELKTATWRKRPVLGEIMRKHGDKILFDYAKDFLDVNKSALLDDRKAELIETAKNLLEKRLGKTVADEVAKQLSGLPLVSTTDHHGPVQHPFFLNSNLISAIPYAESQNPDLKYLPVFSFASVSVNNASTFTRGIIFHGSKAEGNLVRLPILPDKFKMGVVYKTRGYNPEDIARAEADLTCKTASGEVAADRGAKVKDFIKEFFTDPDILASRDLNEQITKINFKLWRRLFHPVKTKKIPDLIYLEIETLVTELLLNIHLKNQGSLIYKVLFDPRFRELNNKWFNNIPGGFSLEKESGSYMFWALDDKLHRVRLFYKDGKLTSGRGTFTFDMNPETIAKALAEKKIFPGMLLCYLMVALYYGMKCLGGFCQVHDLTRTKEAWSGMLAELGMKDEVAALAPVQTKELGGDGMVLPYFKTKTGDFMPATGVDMAIDKENDTSFEKYIELSKKVTLNDMMSPMLPEMYTVLYAIQDRDPNLLATPEEIFKGMRLGQKLYD